MYEKIWGHENGESSESLVTKKHPKWERIPKKKYLKSIAKDRPNEIRSRKTTMILQISVVGEIEVN